MNTQINLFNVNPLSDIVKQTLGATSVRFDGADYSPKHDQVRLAKQTLRVFSAMKDGKWRTLGEIAALTGDPEASISARLRDLRKERFGGHTVNRRNRGERSHGLFEYQLEARR
jgi:hypothetical protein